MRSALRAVVVSAIVAAVSLEAFPFYLAIRSMGSSAFEPQPFDFVLVGASTFALALGMQIVPRWTDNSIVLVSLLASGALLFGFFAIFSIGLALLPVGIVAMVLLYRGLRRRGRSWALTGAALGGSAMGFAIPLLFIALIIPATIECRDNGGSTSSQRWRRTSAIRMATSGSVDPRSGVQTGTIDDGDSVVTYRCEGTRLVEFQRVSR